MKFNIFTILTLLLLGAVAQANRVSESQQSYIERYQQQKRITPPAEALINTDPEPDLTQGFTSLFNGENLNGWVVRGGDCIVEVKDGVIVGTVVPGAPSTYLCTEREDYRDFIFTAEVKWDVPVNSGVQFRSFRRQRADQKFETIHGPQAELEGYLGERGWSGGIFGQGAGGWLYPLWLDAHEEVRGAHKNNEWNRITIKAVGSNVKIWFNGLPATHWETEEYREGFFGLQIHSAPRGVVLFRNLKVKELPEPASSTNLFHAEDFSAWSRVRGGPVARGWSILEGVIHRSGLRPGDIITRASYQDFVLDFEWKISEGGNSGIKYRTRGSLGPEYQILDDSKHHHGNDPLRNSGSLYDIIPHSDAKVLRPAGEWNQGRIVAKGAHIEHWMNGEKILEAEIGSELWNKALSQSKFSAHEGFGTWNGPILLQDHLDEVWFRNVRITQL